uniref:Uncharacterized protein n=1 Tax=Manihot esculenta TaxID=3983 RepID=A0A2C9UFL5_MANES
MSYTSLEVLILCLCKINNILITNYSTIYIHFIIINNNKKIITCTTIKF